MIPSLPAKATFESTSTKLQLYSLPTPNGVVVSIFLEELKVGFGPTVRRGNDLVGFPTGDVWVAQL